MAKGSISKYSPDPRVATVATLMGDPGRASILAALLGGLELSAGELAEHARLAPNAASAHLSKLVLGGLLHVRSQGRRRYFCLAGPEVARAMEALSVVAPPTRIVALAQAQRADELRHARTCYDHLAGWLGVAITDSLVLRGELLPIEPDEYEVTARGGSLFDSLAIDIDRLRRIRRRSARQCLDWSERRPHLAGALGADLCRRFLEYGWVERTPVGRAVRVTEPGRDWLLERLGIEVAAPSIS